MKKIIIFTPFVLATIVLAAHFFRLGNILVTGICLVFPLIFFYKKPATLFIARAFMVVATLEWGKTTAQFIVERMDMGTDWTRLALIMGAVVAFNILILIVFCISRTLKSMYFKA